MGGWGRRRYSERQRNKEYEVGLRALRATQTLVDAEDERREAGGSYLAALVKGCAFALSNV